MSTLSIKNQYNGQLESENFFALVREYEQNYIHACRASNQEYSNIGGDGSPTNEVIRFKSVNSLGFSLDAIKNLNLDKDKPDHYEFFVSFMGLIGSAGVLPQHYIKLSLERIKHGDYALSEFINIFEHRLISLYYKAWGKYKLPVQYESSPIEGNDNFSSVIKGFSGFYRSKALQLYYSGHYAKNNRPLSNLKLMLNELLSAKVTINSMIGQWLPISKRDQCVLGVRGKNNQLGTGIILGKRYWDIQSKIMICISDIDMKKFLALQSGESLYELFASMVNAYVPTHISVDVEFRVNGSQKQMAPVGKGYQLSKNAWLMSRPKDTLFAKSKIIRN